jgi:hypothetical protein
MGALRKLAIIHVQLHMHSGGVRTFADAVKPSYPSDKSF